MQSAREMWRSGCKIVISERSKATHSTMLRFAILELLLVKPLSGYELKRRFEGSIVFFWRANHSQLYPELRRMEKDGLVASNQVTQGSRPTKRLYTVTPAGREALRMWLRQPPRLRGVKDEMMLRCFSFQLVEPAEARDQIAECQRLHNRQLDFYLGVKRQLEERHGDLSETDDPIIFWNVQCLYHAIDYEEMYVNWCTRALLDQEAFLRKQAERDEGASGAVAGKSA